MAVEKRVVFRSTWLPWVLLAPQVVVIVVFFFWPAGQALLQSFQQSDAFGTSTEWVGLENFQRLFADDTYVAVDVLLREADGRWRLIEVSAASICVLTAVWPT